MNGDIDSDIPCTRRIKVIDINPHLMCVLCGGYYVDATTIIECLHSFCKSCIVRYLDTSKFCPICDVQVHKTKPLLNIRSDQTLQDIVYKLVPDLFQREMRRRRDFYAKQPAEALKRTNEERGEVDYASFPHNIFSPDEFISIALEYSAIGGAGISNGHDTAAAANDKSPPKNVCRRYLRCPVVITVAHIKKLIRAKYGLSSEQRVDLMFSRDSLSDEFMIMDIAYMYAWKRKGPLKLYYRIFDQPNKRLKTFHAQPPVSLKDPGKPVSVLAALSTDEKKSGSHHMRSTTIDEGKQSDNKTSPERHAAEKAAELSMDSKQISSIKAEESKELKSRTNEIGVKTKAPEDEESKKESEKQKDGDKDKKMDVVVAAAAIVSTTTATAEHKITLEKTTTEDIVQQQQSACEIKTNGDFRANAVEKPLLREKVNGITTNGKDSISISREIESCT